MKTFIKVNLDIEGTHQWSGVVDTPYKDEVGYLQYPHRHIFKIMCKKEVFHDDRDIEFIAFKHEITSYLRQEFWSTHDGLCVFGEMSCEMIAKMLCLKFNLVECEVSEDGENGAIVVNE